MTTKPQSTEPELKPCRCGRKAMIEGFYDGDDPQPLFVATCEICPVKTYDQFTADEAARIWNEFVSATPANAAPLLCPVHAGLDEQNKLELEITNDCVACSLNQRVEMLKVLEMYIPDGETVDAVGFLIDKLSATGNNGVAFTAYNQAIEDAKAAIRAESQGGGYWSAVFINAIARKCSPHVYVNRLADASPASATSVVDTEKLIPANWLDPLLTGPEAVIGKPPYNCPDIERLLNAIRKRIRDAGSGIVSGETYNANT